MVSKQFVLVDRRMNLIIVTFEQFSLSPLFINTIFWTMSVWWHFFIYIKKKKKKCKISTKSSMQRSFTYTIKYLCLSKDSGRDRLNDSLQKYISLLSIVEKFIIGKTTFKVLIDDRPTIKTSNYVINHPGRVSSRYILCLYIGSV
jgi:hypothetical protein